MLLALVIGFLGVTFCVLYSWRRKQFSVFKKYGIPGPEPSLISGNFYEIVNKGLVNATTDWIEKYGNIVGYYFGSVPFLIVNDVDLLKKVMVQDFANFNARGAIGSLGRYHPKGKNGITVAVGKEWKRIRAALTPSFKPSIMKEVFAGSGRIREELISSLEKAAEKEGSIQVDHPTGIVKWRSFEILARAIFGAEMTPDGEGSPVEARLMQVIRRHPQPFDVGPISRVAQMFSEYSTLWRTFLALQMSFFRNGVDDYEETVNAYINLQLQSKESRKSVLRVIMDVLVDGHDDIKKASENGRQEAMITKDEALANCMGLIVAGYESNSNAVTFAMYLLAKHPDIQEKVRAEVLKSVQKEGTLTYEGVTAMSYLDNVVSESLRLYPPSVHFSTRRADKDYKYNGMTIPKGVSVVPPNFHLQRDPKYWSDPEAFIPERFSMENKGKVNTVAYQPFGLGLRKCIGTSLGLLHMKLCIATLVTNFRMTLDEERHKGELRLRSTVVSLHAKDGIWLKFEKLENATGSPATTDQHLEPSS